MVFKKKSKIDYEDLYTRVSADFQNYKRRVEKERASWIAQAKSDVIRPLLMVMDDLERATESCRKQKSVDGASVLAGLELVSKNVAKTFSDLGVEEIDCSSTFDPALHEALVQVESEDHETGEIVEVVVKGYLFQGQVLRHAKVSVAK
ncbi:nucleotide exchange factor GrpE [Candidatus Dependentiae bacterium]|nr:nucleotide exchange factor GrpE [Candidatus Dependentiae bacterium]